MTTQRPATVTVAAVLLALFSLLGFVSVFVPAFSEGVRRSSSTVARFSEFSD